MIQVNQYIDYNGMLLIVKRSISEHNLNPNFNVAVMKEWTMSDTLLRKDGYLYCCEIMQEASIFKPEDDIQLQLEFPEDH